MSRHEDEELDDEISQLQNSSRLEIEQYLEEAYRGQFIEHRDVDGEVIWGLLDNIAYETALVKPTIIMIMNNKRYESHYSIQEFVDNTKFL